MICPMQRVDILRKHNRMQYDDLPNLPSQEFNGGSKYDDSKRFPEPADWRQHPCHIRSEFEK